MGKPFQSGRCVRWSAGCLLAFSLSSGAASHDVDFSILLPEAERVYLVGSFNNGEISDVNLMAGKNGLWRKTLSLEDGTYSYRFKAEGGKISGDGWVLDWKSSRTTRQKGTAIQSVLVVPNDLDAFLARQRGADKTKTGIKIPLSYERCPDKDAAYRFGGYAHQELDATPPPGDWKLPDLVGERPLFALVQLGDSKFLAAIDRKSSTDKFYNRAFFDQNGNGDLTDEKPLAGESRAYSQGEYFDCSFPAVDVEIDVDGQRLPYCLGMRLSGMMPQTKTDDGSEAESLRNIRCMVSPRCAYLGEFALDGTAYRLALCDATADGIVGDPAEIPDGTRYANRSLYAHGDTFYLAAADRVNSSDGLLFGRFLSLGERLFEIQVDIPAGQMILKPRDRGNGWLELPAPMRTMTMMSASGAGALMLVNTAARAPVPAGSWRLLDYQLLKKDAWGDEWLLQARGVEDMPAVAVPENDSAPLAVGEPLRAAVEIPEQYLGRAASSGSLRISLGLVGRANERITDLRHFSGTQTRHKKSTRNPDRPEEASYRIVKPDGEKVASGSFEYG